MADGAAGSSRGRSGGSAQVAGRACERHPRGGGTLQGAGGRLGCCVIFFFFNADWDFDWSKPVKTGQKPAQGCYLSSFES